MKVSAIFIPNISNFYTGIPTQLERCFVDLLDRYKLSFTVIMVNGERGGGEPQVPRPPSPPPLERGATSAASSQPPSTGERVMGVRTVG